MASIDLPYTYDYKNEYKSYTFRITWATSDPYTITDKGMVSHAHSEIKVTLMATIACTGVSEKVKFEIRKIDKISNIHKKMLLYMIYLYILYK